MSGFLRFRESRKVIELGRNLPVALDQVTYEELNAMVEPDEILVGTIETNNVSVCLGFNSKVHFLSYRCFCLAEIYKHIGFFALNKKHIKPATNTP